MAIWSNQEYHFLLNWSECYMPIDIAGQFLFQYGNRVFTEKK